MNRSVRTAETLDASGREARMQKMLFGFPSNLLLVSFSSVPKPDQG